MDMQVEQRVRERAYQIWIEAGKASGLEHEHWHTAVREVAATVRVPKTSAKSKSSTVEPSTVKPKAAAKVTVKPKTKLKTVKAKAIASKTAKATGAAASMTLG